MTKAIDRLELVADEKEVSVVRSSAQQVEELGLEPVRVLELVDHQRAKPLLLALADPDVVAQQVARSELEVFEVERRLGILRLRVRVGERGEQLLQELAVAGGELLQRRRDDGIPRLGERSGPGAARLEVEQREQPLG